MYEKFKTWAWSTPTFENHIWDKVDTVVDKGLEVAFGNKVMVKYAEVIDRVLNKLETKVTRIMNAFKEK